MTVSLETTYMLMIIYIILGAISHLNHYTTKLHKYYKNVQPKLPNPSPTPLAVP